MNIFPREVFGGNCCCGALDSYGGVVLVRRRANAWMGQYFSHKKYSE
jgi:hypothetical protein